MSLDIGVCCFDDPYHPEGGWASIAGSVPKRVSGPHELSSAVLWVTNIPYKPYMALGYHKVPHIFDEQYFRTSVKLLAAEMGVSSSNKDAAVFCSRVFTRLVRYGHETLGIDLSSPGYRYYTLISAAISKPSMRKLPSAGILSDDLREGLKHAYQENQAITGISAPKGSYIKPFIVPRGAHARWLLTRSYPTGEKWSEIGKKDRKAVFGYENGGLVRGTKGVLEKLLNLSQDSAAIFRVEVVSTHKGYQNFSGFGVGSKTHRRWATLPEIINMSRYSKLSIDGGYQTTIGRIGLPESISLSDSEYSFSRGLFYENLWIALASPLYQTKSVSGINSYMRAYDRVACMKISESFVEHQYNIGSYGAGRVMIYIRPQEKKEVSSLSLSMGVIPPFELMDFSPGEDDV